MELIESVASATLLAHTHVTSSIQSPIIITFQSFAVFSHVVTAAAAATIATVVLLVPLPGAPPLPRVPLSATAVSGS